MARNLVKTLHRNALFYNYLSIVFGCRNYYYDRKLHYFRLDHKPTLIYTSVLNTIYVSAVPYAAAKIIASFRSCVLGNLMIYINWITSVVNITSFFITLGMIWLRRSQLCKLANRLIKLIGIFNYEAEVSEGIRRILNKAQRLILVKSLATLCIYCQSVYWVYESSQQGCGHKLKAISIRFLISIVFTGVLMIMEMLVEYNVYLGLLHGNMLLSGWLHEMTGIRDEVRSLSAAERHMDRIPSWHAIHWLQLLQHSERIIGQQRETKDFLWRFVGYQQFHMLTSLFKIFLETIALAFDIVVYLNTGHKSPIYLLVTLLIKFGNTTMLFYECEGIQRQSVKMRQIVFEIRQELPTPTKCEARKEMSQVLEMFSLEMQHKNENLTLCGFFDLNMATARNMIKGVVMNLLLLIQFAFKDFQREMLKKKNEVEN